MSESEQEYFTALGQFIQSFAFAESAVQVALWKIGDIEDKVAKAIFSGTRTRTAVDFIRRVSESKNLVIPPEINAAFVQLNTINTTRDRIVHFGATEKDDGTRVVSNWLKAHTEKSLKEFPISPNDLYEMAHDIAVIVARLVSHYLGRDPDVSDTEWEESMEVANTPFRYKPTQSTGR